MLREPRLKAGLAAVCLAALCGCGEEPVDALARPTVPVSMTATIKGQPMTDAVVVFHPTLPDQSPVTPRGKVSEDGSVVVSTFRPGDGLPPGEYRVSLTWQGPLAGLDEDEIDALPERMPRQYRRPDTSGLTVAVAESADGPAELPPIAL